MIGVRLNQIWNGKHKKQPYFIFSCKENTLKRRTHNHAPTILDLINQGFTTNHNLESKKKGRRRPGST